MKKIIEKIIREYKEKRILIKIAECSYFEFTPKFSSTLDFKIENIKMGICELIKIKSNLDISYLIYDIIEMENHMLSWDFYKFIKRLPPEKILTNFTNLKTSI